MPPRLEGGVKRAPAKRRKPQPVPASIFGPLGRADRPIVQAQRTAHKRVQRAQARLPERPLPSIPILRRPTQRQAQTAVTLTRRATRKLTPAQKRELLQDPRSRAKLAATQRSRRIQGRAAAELIARALQPQGRPVYGPPTPTAPLTMVDALTRKGVEHPRYLPTGRSARIQLGREIAARTRAQASPGPAPTRVGLGPATINATALRRSVMAASSLSRAPLGPRQYVKNAIKDLAALGSFPVLAGWEAEQAAGEALKDVPGIGALLRAANRAPVVGNLIPEGHGLGRAGRLGASVGEGIAASAPAKLLTGHPLAAAEQFVEHPVFAPLDFLGAESVVGRTAGAITRAATRGARAGRVRPPLALSDDPATAVLHQRSYSGDVFRQGAQKHADAGREPLRDVNGEVVTTVDRGKTVPVLKATPMERERLQRRKANFEAARVSSVEKFEREAAHKESRAETKAHGVKGRRARDLVAMVAEGTILTGKSFKADLETSAARLEREYQERMEADPKGYRTSEEAQANRDRLETVQKALATPKVMAQAERIASAGIAAGRRLTEKDRELMARGVLSEGSGYRSRLMHAAIAHIPGVRHYSVEEHRALEKAARQREHAAAEAVKTATGPAKREAYAAYQRARRDRIAVSGRHPEKVRAHEEAKHHVSKAERAVNTAKAEHARAEKALQRLGGAQQVQRGGEAGARLEIAARGGRRAQHVLQYIDRKLADEQQLQRGAQAERSRGRKRAEADQRVKVAREKRRRAEKALRKARHRLRENPEPETRAALRKEGGRFLSNREIEDTLRARGRDPETVGFLPGILPGKEGVFGRRAHHTQYRVESRPDFDKQTRTGELYRKGASAATADLLRDQGVRQATQLAKAEHIDRSVTENGVRHPAWAKAKSGEQLTAAERRIVNRGGYRSGPEAAEAISRLADAGEDYVAVTAHGGKLSAKTQEMIRTQHQDPQAMEGLAQRLFNDRIVSPEELGKTRTRNIVLFPGEFKRQMDAHLRPAGEIERTFQVVNRAFRLAVLPQPRWLTGNFVEPYFIRLPAYGSGAVNVPGLLVDWRATLKATRIMKRSGDPRMQQLARDIEAHQFGGMFLGRRGASVRRAREDFKTYGHIVKKLPAVEQFADLAAGALKVVTWPLEKILEANRPIIEAPVQRAAFGRLLRREIHEITGSYGETIRLGEKAVREALEGLVGTPTQERFMRSQHEMLGKYEGYGPTMRRLIQTIMPFAPWALSAARFVYWTMPVHHSALTALLVRTQDAMQDEWKRDHADAPPGSLQLAARTKDRGFLDFARYTPYGLTGPIAQGDPQGATDQFLPQLTGAVAALSGTDAFGRPLRVAPTPENPRGIPSGGQKAGIAGYTLLEALVPYLSTTRRLREHGETAYAGSTVVSPKTKPGTGHGQSALQRTFDPFRPTYLTKGGGGIGEVVKPTGRVRPQRQTQAQRDADLLRRAVHGPAASGISSEDLDLIRRAASGR